MLAAVDVRDPVVRPPISEGGREEPPEDVDVSPSRATVSVGEGRASGGGAGGDFQSREGARKRKGFTLFKAGVKGGGEDKGED